MYIPENLNSINLTETDIRYYYSLDPVDEYDMSHKKRMSKHISEFITFQNGGTFTSIESQKQKKKRLSAAVRDKPTNSKVFIAFNFWRKQQIDKHIIIQMKNDTIETSVSDDKKRIQELENLLKDKDTEIRKLNNKIKKMKTDKTLKRTTKQETPVAEEPEIPKEPDTPPLGGNPPLAEEPKEPEPTPEPVLNEQHNPYIIDDEDENPYDNTCDEEALEIFQERIDDKINYFSDIIKEDPTMKSNSKLHTEAFIFIDTQIELIIDIHDELDCDELMKKLKILQDHIDC